MATWQEVAQDWGGKILDAAIDYKVTQPYEVQKLQLQALGDFGYYIEGQPGTTQRITAAPVQIPTSLLLIGAAVVLIVLLKD
jgi:hypothetical protein